MTEINKKDLSERDICTKFITPSNVQWHEFLLNDLKKMRFEDNELEEYKIKYGDLLICEGGEPGRCAIWEDGSTEIYFQKALHRARPYSGILSKYLMYCLTLDAKRGILEQYFTGATIKHFTGKKLNKYIFPLPPAYEQKRIIEKIESLFRLCGHLQKQLEKYRNIADLLARSVVESITGQSTEKQEKAKTQLTTAPSAEDRGSS